jgi:hypothetical protein
MIEEVFEMNGALTLLFAVFATRYALETNMQAKGVGSEKMKNMPIFVGIVLAFLISGTLIIYFYLSSITNKLETESRAYVVKIIPLIFTSWDFEAFISHMSPEMHQSETYRSQVKESFDKQSDMVGLLKGFELTKGRVLKKKEIPIAQIQGRKVTFYHLAKLIFENSHAHLKIVTILERDRWWILIVRIEHFPKSILEENS